MNPTDLMEKASRAVASARLLLAAEDRDGACNRAYYAMFDAARAALLRSGASLDPTVAKTHGGLISAFSLHLVKTARLPVELGRALNRAAEIRLIADYSGDQVTRDKVEWLIEQADCFLKTVQQEFPERSVSDSGS